MSYTCRDCKRSFGTQLELDLHRDNCVDGQLICERCGTRFAEGEGTDDGWYYRCPAAGCDGSGIGEDIRRVGDIRLEVT
ncbi:MAG: transcriptional regulator [Haloarculaceae archaeon]